MKDTDIQSCEVLIDEKLFERELDAKEALATHENIALGVATETVYTITLSWGGPADYIEVRCVDNEIINMSYIYQDWFDGARRDIEEDSHLWKYAVHELGL